MRQRYLALITIPAILNFWSCKTTGGDSQLQENRDLEVAPECKGYSEAVGDPLKWIQSKSQPELEKIFACAPSSKTVPSGLGIGRGSLYQTWPAWNESQAKIGSYIWGGKRLYKQPGGATCLLNQMNDSHTERYMAHVYVDDSNRQDGKKAIILDYRVDKTEFRLGFPVQMYVDSIAKGIRDEIREVAQDGKGSGVFVGRANLNKKAFLPFPNLNKISPKEFADPEQYHFAANFILDFRPNDVKAFGEETPHCVPEL